MKISFRNAWAILLSLILVMTVFVGGTGVTAVSDDENATVTQTIYNTHDVNTPEEVVANIGNLSQSVLSGKTPLYYNGTDYILGSDAFKLLTDNTIGTFFNQNFYKSYSYEHEGTTYSGTASRMYFDLSASYKLTSVILVDASNTSSSNLTLPSFKVFLSNSASGHQLFDVEASNTSYSITANTTTPGDSKAIVYNITFAEPVTAKYIGFEFPDDACAKGVDNVVIYEVAAFGTEIPADVKIASTTGMNTDAVPTNAKDNIIYGKTIAESTASAFAHFTDGANTGKGAGGSGWPYKLTYQLDGNFKINEVQVISGTNDNRIGEFEIYISDSASTLFDGENLKATVTGTHVNWITGGTTIDTVSFSDEYATEGTFFGLKLIKKSPATATGASYIHEVIVKGTEVVKDITVTTAAGSKTDTFDTSKNLIYGKEPAEYTGVANIGWITDGNSQNARVLSTVNTLSYDLGGAVKVDEIVLVTTTDTYRVGDYEIYVANSKASLYNTENLVATITDPDTVGYNGSGTTVDTIKFSETYAKTGKWVGFKIIERQLASATASASFFEIEVKGVKQATVTASAGLGGTITSEGETLLEGSPVEYTFTPNEGYKVAEVLVNGEAAALTDGKYTFAGTEEGWNTIHVTFALIGDTNNDGNINQDDLLVIKQDILGIEKADITYADIDGDGDIDLLDLVTAYEIQQGISPAVASLEATLNLTHSEYTAAINRASEFNTASTSTDRLNAVFEKAQNGQSITIAAIGGSITEGAGSNVMSGVSVSAEELGVTISGSTYQNSKYFDRVVNWFNTEFKASEVKKINAGISGTPSFFGTFRLENDVLKYNPDLVIVEFSVNDLGNYQLDSGYMLDAYESVIRKCLDNGSAVIAVFTVNNLTYQTTNIGNSWQSYHKAIADHYNIPTISYHNAIYPDNEWITEWTKLSGDNVHPNVAGHALLANCITSYLEEVYKSDNHKATVIPDEWYHNDTFAETDIIYMGDVEFNGMTKTASNKYGYIARNAVGTGNESITAKIPAGATEVYVFYNTINNAGSIHAKLGNNAESEAFSTNVSSISYSHGEWTRIYNGQALSEDTDLIIRSANDGKALEILTILVVK